ncbi:MAG: c-type cytochrome [Burkholderiales bacterium]|nr:c-type cytochrome [Burkholderiales bacterium]
MTLRFQWKVLAFLGAAMLAPLFSAAQAVPSRAPMCSACHGPNGNSQLKDVPSLAGQPKIFIENQLVLIREGMRDIAQMKGMLDNVPDSELTALAVYYASLPIAKPTAKRQAGLFARGETLSQEMRCGICHLPTYVGREQMPRLAGQREDYLLYTMRAMKANQAVGRDSIMIASLYGISDEDLQAISHYLSRLAN